MSTIGNTTKQHNQKTRVGSEDKNYSGKRKEICGNERIRVRVDSAVKLLQHKDGWQIKRSRDYARSWDGCVRETGDEFRDLTEDDIERIAEKTQQYRYRADVYPDENKLKIWDNALGTWELTHPDLQEVMA